MATETEPKAASDLRREVEEVSQKLASKGNQLLAAMKSGRNEKGEPCPETHQLENITRLEAECQQLTATKSRLQYEYLQAKTEEALTREGAEPLQHVALFSGEGGTATKSGEQPTGRWASIGEAFVNSPAYKQFHHGAQNQSAFLEMASLGFQQHAMKALREQAMKTTLDSTGLTSYDRPPGLIMLGQQPLTVADLCSQAQTDNTTIRYLQESSFTNAADTVAEGGAKPEQTFVVAEANAPVQKIAEWTKVTDELFSDYPAVRDYINQRMPFAIRQKEELQILAGNGTPPNIQGISGTSGVLTQSATGYSNADAIYLGITKVRTTGFWEPDAVVIDPTNWTPIRLLKTTTGEYVYGDPWTPGPETIFGKRVVVTVNQTDNTALVGNFRMGATIYYREGVRIDATNSNGTDFQNNLITLRAEERLALAVWRPTAFCTVTSLSHTP